MAKTYADDPDPTGTATQKRDFIRFLTQTNIDPKLDLLSDAEIDAIVGVSANSWLAASTIAGVLAMRVGPIASKSVGDVSISYSRSDYMELSREWRKNGLSHQVPFVGGRLITDQDTIDQNVDLKERKFHNTVHDNSGNTTGVIRRRQTLWIGGDP